MKFHHRLAGIVACVTVLGVGLPQASADGPQSAGSLLNVTEPSERFVAAEQSPVVPCSFTGCTDGSASSCGTACGGEGCSCGNNCSCGTSSCGTGCGSSCGTSGLCGGSLLDSLGDLFNHGDSSNCGCSQDVKLFGFIAQSDHCWDDFVSPMTNPVFFEDPRTLTEVRALFVNHKLPGRLGGNSVQLYALQLRAALTDRLSIIATKDGFFTSSNPLVDDGWADVAAGLKYNLIKDHERRFLLSTGFTYEMPVGERKALQGNGDGLWDLFLTGGIDLGGGFHFVSASGFLLPSNRNQESSMWYLSNHIDQHIGKGFYWLGELNLFHWMGSGQNGVNGVEGLDVINLGSTGVAGNNIVTAAIGVKYKPTASQEIGVAWEVPLTHRRDILENRLTVDWRIRY